MLFCFILVMKFLGNDVVRKVFVVEIGCDVFCIIVFCCSIVIFLGDFMKYFWWEEFSKLLL